MTANHYEVLGLPPLWQTASKETLDPATIKVAYHKTLLRHHPDKGLSSTSRSGHGHTVDEIREAFNVLNDPARRGEYDRELSLRGNAQNSGHAEPSLVGIESVDLEDMTYDEDKNIWRRSCRCGHEKGFVLLEDDLEEAHNAGGREVLVGCEGCSLWLKVAFAVAE